MIYLLALVGSVVLYAANQEWFAWVLLLVVAILPWVSLLLSILPMAGLKMELDVAEKLPMGSAETATVTVSSKLPMPPHRAKIRVTNVMTAERRTLRSGVKLPTEHCGKWQVQLHRPAVCDYLGLFCKRIRNTAVQTVYVLPRPVEIKIPPELSKHLQPRWRAKPGGGFAENYEIREFHPGDSLNKIHWKLSAKVGDLMLREPMEPQRGLMLLTLDLNGSASELDLKLGRLLYLSRWLLAREVTFDIRALTAKGVESWTIREQADADKCIESLLGTPFAREGSICDQSYQAAWRYHIGGEQGEN